MDAILRDIPGTRCAVFAAIQGTDPASLLRAE